jgi:hypothetical protein
MDMHASLSAVSFVLSSANSINTREPAPCTPSQTGRCFTGSHMRAPATLIRNEWCAAALAQLLRSSHAAASHTGAGARITLDKKVEVGSVGCCCCSVTRTKPASATTSGSSGDTRKKCISSVRVVLGGALQGVGGGASFRRTDAAEVCSDGGIVSADGICERSSAAARHK